MRNEDVGNLYIFPFVVSVVLVVIVSSVFEVVVIVFVIIVIVVLYSFQGWPLEVFKVALKAKIGLQIRRGLVISLLKTSKAVKFKNCIRITRTARPGPSCLSFCWTDKEGHFLEK